MNKISKVIYTARVHSTGRKSRAGRPLSAAWFFRSR